MTEQDAAKALQEELPRQECCEFQAFLSFNNDEDGIAFREWWGLHGAKAFAKWFPKWKAERI